MSEEIRVKEILANRRARFEYTLGDKFEAGLSLLGSEVKSLREGRVTTLNEAFIMVDAKGAKMLNLHIPPYPWANRNNHEPRRERRLLLNRHEIEKLRKGLTTGGMTIVPLRLYWKGNKVKLEIALGKGKKTHDKRAAIKDRDAKREMERHR